MSEDKTPKFNVADANELAAAWSQIAESSRRLLEDFWKRQSDGDAGGPKIEELSLALRPFQTFFERVAENPQNFLAAQGEFVKNSLTLWQQFGRRALGAEAEPVIEPAKGDRRFRDGEWSQNPVFDFVKQSYLLASKFITDSLPEAQSPDDVRAKQMEFYTRQFIDAMSPTNFAAANPTVLRQTVETGGQNLVNGLKNLLDDLERGKGRLRTKMTDPEAFEVGRNVGTTPGKVVFENELIQLIQYTPTTEQVYARPLVIVPPWINKFYILDLQPRNSFIKWAIDQGHTVFVISWVNPGRKLADKTFDDYLKDGALAAIDAAAKASGNEDVNLVGYCLGGTLLACVLAYMAANGDTRAKSATYFASLADFAEPGDLGVFIDEEHLALIDAQMERDGYLDGSAMATAFNALRANDLIWSFVINNYLMGRDPIPFDLLYWNSDSTRMPKAMHSYYLREMYLNNRLREPGGITLDGTPIDLRAIETPTYMVATKEDHIAPWKSTYASTQLFGGPTRFVLGGSGHIAGIINPPSDNKYGYELNPDLPPSADDWLAGAEHREGSWWTDWQAWVTGLDDNPQVPARVPGTGALEAIEDAPGRYAKVRDLAND